jgi:hypothetical protein
VNKIPFLKLNNGEILQARDVKKTINGELTLQEFSYGYDIASRTSIINHLIHKYKFNNYLEIGVRDGRNYDKIIIKNKTGVDPEPTKEINNLKKVTSDVFFENNKEFFDIIFIDGLHIEQQVDKDINNSLNFLSNDGYIVMHDCNPPTEFHQRESYEVNGKFPPWNGTVWKSFAKLRIHNKDLQLCCVDCDWGVGIIRKKNSENFKTKKILDYDLLDKNRKELLNLMSVSFFLNNFA